MPSTTLLFWQHGSIVPYELTSRFRDSPEYRAMVRRFRNAPCFYDGTFVRFTYLGARTVPPRKLPYGFREQARLTALLLGLPTPPSKDPR